MTHQQLFEKIFNENKDRFIDKAIAITREQKQEMKDFFKKHPNLENKIDWNNPNLEWEDFLAVKEYTENSKSNKKKAVKGDLSIPFKSLEASGDCKILYYDKNVIFVAPLSYKCCVFMDSFDCYGVGAKWCVGWKENNQKWIRYCAFQKNMFIFCYRNDTKEKLMFQNTGEFSNINDNYYEYEEDSSEYNNSPFENWLVWKATDEILQDSYEYGKNFIQICGALGFNIDKNIIKNMINETESLFSKLPINKWLEKLYNNVFNKSLQELNVFESLYKKEKTIFDFEDGLYNTFNDILGNENDKLDDIFPDLLSHFIEIIMNEFSQNIENIDEIILLQCLYLYDQAYNNSTFNITIDDFESYIEDNSDNLYEMLENWKETGELDTY